MLRLHPFQPRPLTGIVDPFAELPGAHAVRLRRIDRLGQALSWARAQQSGQHRADDPPADPVEYDAAPIRSSLEFSTRKTRSGPAAPARLVPTLEVRYEDLERDPQAEVDLVAGRLPRAGGARADRPRPRHRAPPADATTQAWRERFVAEAGGDRAAPAG